MKNSVLILNVMKMNWTKNRQSIGWSIKNVQIIGQVLKNVTIDLQELESFVEQYLQETGETAKLQSHCCCCH